MLTVTDPLGHTTTNVYDGNGNRLATVTDNRLLAQGATSGLTTYNYDAVGNLQNFVYPNAVTHAYTYDALNRLTQVGSSKSSTAISNYAYTLGAAGNRTSVAELSGRNAGYGYDSLYRLTSETVAGDPGGKNGSIGYTYDAVGNRKTLNATLPPAGAMNYSYDADDRLASDQYDNNGNTILSGGISDVYDFENHLVQKGGVAIVYDGDGNRVSETVGGVTTSYLVETLNPTGYAQVVDELQNGAVTRSYSYGLERISEKQSVGTNFYGYDGHGSVRQLTDPTGAVTDSYDYDAFGNLINSTGSTPNVYLFAGEAYDSALGLYYNRARYLNIATGRFWSTDSDEGKADSPASLNSYLYGGASPVDLTDPSGHDFGSDAFSISGTLDAFAIPSLSGLLSAVNGAIDKVALSGGAYKEWQKYQSKAQKSVFNPDCVKCLALAGQTPDELAIEISAQIAWDGTSSKIKRSEAGMYDFNWSIGVARTVKALDIQAQQWFRMNPKVRAFAALGNHGSYTDEVYFGRGWDQITLIHEALHWLTLEGDQDLAKDLGGKNLGGTYEASEYISTKLSDTRTA